MAVVIHLATATQVGILKAVKALVDAGSAGGKINIYNAPMPASANDAISTQTLLGVLTFSSTCASDPTTGTMTYSAITKDSAANDTGIAAWARITDSDDNIIYDTNVGTAGCGVNLVSVNIVKDQEISFTSGNLLCPSGE